jgi:parvulin-like peptidyl-prolyl isomerase
MDASISKGDYIVLNWTYLSRVTALCAAGCTLLSLVGCQGHKIVARVNSIAINEDEFESRALRVTQIPQGMNTDAGGLTLVNMIKDSLTDQLAADPKYHGVPGKDEVSRFLDALKKLTPQLVNAIRTGQRSEEETERQVRNSIEQFRIGTDGAVIDDKDLQEVYKDQISKGQFKIPTSYTLRLLLAPTQAAAQQALDDLKKTGDFKKTAQILNLGPQEIATAGTPTVVIGKQPAPMGDVLDKLKPNELTPAPVPVPLPQQTPGLPPQTVYVIAQLISKETERVPSLEELRPITEQVALAKKFPQWKQHADQMLAEFTRRSSIVINYERYAPLLNAYILPQAQINTPGGAALPPDTSSSGPPPAPEGQAQPPSPEPPTDQKSSSTGQRGPSGTKKK